MPAGVAPPGGTVTVAIPTRNAGAGFAATLAAVTEQELFGVELELLICDSGSSDQTVALARDHGAEVIEIAPEDFSHGGTRNLLMREARGDHVAFLTQDAVPADSGWLAGLLAGFALAPRVGLTFGPYRARPGASPYVKRELSSWFASFTSADRPRVETLEDQDRDAPPQQFLGHRGYFTDANGCVARAAWTAVPFREVGYAEDHLLAQDMLRAGFAKVFMPAAGVVHSHDYSLAQWVRRSFDEARAVREVYDWPGPPGRWTGLREIRGHVGEDRRWLRTRAETPGGAGVHHRPEVVWLLGSLGHHSARGLGTWLGRRADRLPRSVIRALSLERRP